MGKHLQRDLDVLKKEILTMGSMVEGATNNAITALLHHRRGLAEEVLTGDDAIDQKENEIEDLVLKTLALHQPVAGDLRFVVMVLKVNHDLERMGDLASNMAERTIDLLEKDPLGIDIPLEEMATRVRAMVRRTLDALVQRDAEGAREVVREDDDIDAMHRQMFEILQRCMHDDRASIERAVDLLSLSRYLERMADHATNIAEDIVFQIEGEVIRHVPEDEI